MRLAHVYEMLGDKEKQAAALSKALESHSDAHLKIRLANLLVEQWESGHGAKDEKQRKEAKSAREEATKLLREASELAGEYTSLHQTIADAYRKLGLMEEEKKERKKIKPPITKPASKSGAKGKGPAGD